MDNASRNKVHEYLNDQLLRRGIINGFDKNTAQEETDLRQVDSNDILEESHEYIYELFRNGIVNIVGTPQPWRGVPLTVLTRYGKKALSQEGAPVYDPEGYIDDVKVKVTEADPTIIAYLSECIQTFNRNCYKSSAVMLGVASEQMIWILYHSLRSSIKNKDTLKRDGYRTIFKTHTKMKNVIQGKDMFEKFYSETQYEDDIKIYFNSLFDLIRFQRNESGHPTVQPIHKSAIYALISCFPVYLKGLYKFKEFLDHHPDEF